MDIEELSLEEIEQYIARLSKRRDELVSEPLTDDNTTALYQCTKQGNRKVVIVGGNGQLGRIFVRLFSLSKYSVQILEATEWHQADKILQNAALVVVAVPIDVTEQVIQQLPPLPPDCVLTDLTSIKAKPIDNMLNVHSGSVVGLHPMFGPDVKDIQGQTVVICHGRGKSNYQWLEQQIQVWQAKTYSVTAEKHDQTMAFVQVLRHFSTAVYGVHLAKEDVCLDDILAMSSPIYRLELAMVGRLFAQEPDLYTEIIFANQDNIEMMERYIKRFEQLLMTLKQNDKSSFKAAFLQTRDWFGCFAQECLIESGLMLSAANKVKSEQSK